MKMSAMDDIVDQEVIDNDVNQLNEVEMNLCRRRGLSEHMMLRYVHTCVGRRIYESARDGMAVTLYALLTNISEKEANEYMNKLVIDGQTQCTPLIIAAKNGHLNIVKLLIMKFTPNLEMEGSVQFDGYLIEGATALWAASSGGHLNIVKCLVEHKADVNHWTKTHSTPLRAACFDGRLDIVKYLVQHNADIHLSNKFNNTPLMISAYKGHLEVVEYLLSLSADPNAPALCGATALHFAAENGHLLVIKELLSHNAIITKNSIGMTPIMTAAASGAAHIVEYFTNSSFNQISEIERIEALELLGASYANDKDSYDLERCYYYMEWAMRCRYRDPNKPLLKRALQPIVAYDNRVECQTLEELLMIQSNSSALHMEALVIRERILGSNNPELPHPIIFRGAVYADSSRFDRCLQLWLHAMRLRTLNRVSIKKDLLRFAQVFSQIINISHDLPFDALNEVMKTAINELNRNKEFLSNCSDDISKDLIQEELDDNIHTALYLIVIITKIMKFLSNDEEFLLCQMIYHLNKLNLKTKDGSSILHLSVNADTPIDDFYTKNVCKFPCATTSKLLIQCGANVNAIDEHRNTPLHLIVAYQKPISDFLTLHAITTALIESGAHMDAVNDKDMTALEASTTGVAEILLKTQMKITLKCLSAKAINKYGLEYRDLFPEQIVHFIDIHGITTKC
ncbi:protein fem-1 homolog B-like [Oppia nitens]|uniref:protein fem-1 homolog B-like n=1 Tax=Oppia nitens TaxID=1686743 RepID=UPI0023DB7494|nr:protein fem-1 homolog B-like [Oppia nitens]